MPSTSGMVASGYHRCSSGLPASVSFWQLGWVDMVQGRGCQTGCIEAPGRASRNLVGAPHCLSLYSSVLGW